jgi:hypothetical protein
MVIYNIPVAMTTSILLRGQRGTYFLRLVDFDCLTSRGGMALTGAKAFKWTTMEGPTIV